MIDLKHYEPLHAIYLELARRVAYDASGNRPIACYNPRLAMKCGDPNNPSGPGYTSRGFPCQRDCAPGLTRCNLHGATAGAKIKAELMLATARLPAIESLYSILEQFQDNTCPTCGFPSGDTDEKRMIIQACRTILDRTGMGPRATIELTKQSDGDLDLSLLNEAERGELRVHLASIRAIKNAVRDRMNGITSAAQVN